MSGTTINPYRFGGQVGYRRDSPARQYVRARHLDTSKGRWDSRDPLGFGGGDDNLYRYVRNALSIRSDPSGLDFTEPGCKEAVTLKQAVLKACSAARRCRCLTPHLKFCLTNICTGVEVNGLGLPIKCGFRGCVEQGICAQANPFTGELAVCPQILFKPGCGCGGRALDPVTQAALNILHELLHFCDVADFNWGPPWSGSNPAQKIAGSCFGLNCQEPGYFP